MTTRNQYQLLAEKYQLIQEDDKEDILAGLDALTDPSLVYYIIYGFNQQGTYYARPIDTITIEKLKKLLQVDRNKYLLNWVDPFTKHEVGYVRLPTVLSQLNRNLLVHLEEMRGDHWLVMSKDQGYLEKYFHEYQVQQGYADEGDVVQENDKDDILTGLDELTTGSLPPKQNVPYFMVKMEADGLFPDWADEVVNGVIPSTARKVIPGVYIETEASPNPAYSDGTDEDGQYTLYITDQHYIKVFKSYAEHKEFTDEQFQQFLRPLYDALGLYEVDAVKPTLPL